MNLPTRREEFIGLLDEYGNPMERGDRNSTYNAAIKRDPSTDSHSQSPPSFKEGSIPWLTLLSVAIVLGFGLLIGSHLRKSTDAAAAAAAPVALGPTCLTTVPTDPGPGGLLWQVAPASVHAWHYPSDNETHALSVMSKGMPNKQFTMHKGPVHHCAYGNQRVLLVGPLSSEVQAWHTLSLPFTLLRRGDRIVRFTGDTIQYKEPTPVPIADETSEHYTMDEGGDVGGYHGRDVGGGGGSQIPMKYPPLHMHHIHIIREVVHWWETHGDYAFDPVHGYRTIVPEGYSVIHDGKKVTINAQVNDVRFSAETGNSGMAATILNEAGANAKQAELAKLRANNPAYEWYLRIGFELEPEDVETVQEPSLASLSQNSEVHSAIKDSKKGSEPSLRSGIAVVDETPPAMTKSKTISKLCVTNPWDAYSANDILARMNVGNETRVYHFSFEMPKSGTQHGNPWIHTHRGRYGGMALVRGKHSLQSLLGIPGKCSTDRSMGSACTDIAATRERLLDIAGPKGTGQVVCIDDPTFPSSVERKVGEAGVGLGGDGIFDRQGVLKCDPFHFKEGETFTIFSFSKPQWLLDMLVFPQHVMIFFFFIPDEAKDESADYSTADQIEPGHGYGVWTLPKGTANEKFKYGMYNLVGDQANSAPNGLILPREYPFDLKSFHFIGV